MVSEGRRDSVGGGVVAEFVRGLRRPTRFSGGGGSSRICPWSPKADAIQWGGGGSSRICPWSPKADAIQWGGGSSARNFPLGPFYIFSLSQLGLVSPYVFSCRI